jgi:hypothetical protein
MEDGQELEVFVVDDLLGVWCRVVHAQENIRARSNGLAKSHFTLTSTAKEEIEITWGPKLRHDLPGNNGKARRGWKGLARVERAVVEDDKTKSCGSVG